MILSNRPAVSAAGLLFTGSKSGFRLPHPGQSAEQWAATTRNACLLRINPLVLHAVPSLGRAVHCGGALLRIVSLDVDRRQEMLGVTAHFISA